MNLPKGKLLALVALVLAASTVMATGAFSTVTAQRSVNVQVVGDENAYLGMQPSPDSPNSAFAKQEGNGELVVNINDQAEGVTGDGVNPDAVTSFDNVFTITNQGTQPVNVWIEDNSERVSFYDGDPGSRLNSQGQTKSIAPGSSLQIGVMVDATDKGMGTTFDLGGDDDMIVHATADGSQAPEEASGGPSGGS